MKTKQQLILSGAKAIKDEISVTLLIVSFVLICGVGLLEVFEKVKSTGPFMELFLTCGGLYFGRKLVKSKSIKTTEKVEEKQE